MAAQGAPQPRVLLCCPCTVRTYSHISPAVLTAVSALQVPVVLVPVQILQQLHLSLQGKLLPYDCPQNLYLDEARTEFQEYWERLDGE